MPSTIYGFLDLVKNELRNTAIQNLGSAPSSPVKGQIYYDTSNNTLFFWDGTIWQSTKASGAAVGYGASTAETAFGTAKADGVATTVARSDHQHGNPVHDAAAHSAIPVSALAAATGTVNLGSQLITNLLAPVSGTDAANKTYVDNTTQGLDAKPSVRAASTANIAALSGTGTFDGIALIAGERILVKDQTTQSANGIYVVAAGAWSRATDMDSWAEVPSAYVWVEQGTAQADTGWVVTADQGGTLGTTNITWTQFSGAGQITAGAGLTKTGNTIDVVAGDTSLTVAADSVAVNTGVIATVASLTAKADTSTAITAGNGLTGGGSLAANRTLDVGAGTGITVAADSVAVDTTVIATQTYVGTAITGKADKTTTLTAGNGLTGGGDLSANRTLDVGAGTGITVAADTVAVDTTVIATQAFVTGQSYAKKYAAALTGTASPETVTHNLNTRDVQLAVLNGASPYTAVEVDWDATTVNTAVIRYSPNLGAGYRVVVTG